MQNFLSIRVSMLLNEEFNEKLSPTRRHFYSLWLFTKDGQVSSYCFFYQWGPCKGCTKAFKAPVCDTQTETNQLDKQYYSIHVFSLWCEVWVGLGLNIGPLALKGNSLPQVMWVGWFVFGKRILILPKFLYKRIGNQLVCLHEKF